MAEKIHKKQRSQVKWPFHHQAHIRTIFRHNSRFLPGRQMVGARYCRLPMMRHVGSASSTHRVMWTRIYCARAVAAAEPHRSADEKRRACSACFAIPARCVFARPSPRDLHPRIRASAWARLFTLRRPARILIFPSRCLGIPSRPAAQAPGQLGLTRLRRAWSPVAAASHAIPVTTRGSI
jgi:hypothetical protein